jgi:hypothetical protein
MVSGDKTIRGYTIDQANVCVKANGERLQRKPDAGNPPVRFGEGGGIPPLLHSYPSLSCFFAYSDKLLNFLRYINLCG